MSACKTLVRSSISFFQFQTRNSYQRSFSSHISSNFSLFRPLPLLSRYPAFRIEPCRDPSRRYGSTQGAISLETSEEMAVPRVPVESPEEKSKDTVEELLYNKDDVSKLMKMERRLDTEGLGHQERWFPYLDKVKAGSMYLSSSEILEALTPYIMDSRKERFRHAVKNRTYSVCLVVEGLSDFGNVSATFRSADALGIQSGAGTERTAPPNSNLRGFDVIDDAKQQIEAVCPGVVSCADILALAARDSVLVTKGLTWSVPTGRRDGRVSSASDTSNLPGFTESVDAQKQKFAAKGLNTQDLVTLVGGHTIGTSACQFFSYRLYNFNSTGGPDPSIDATFLSQLQALCPQNGDGSKRVALDTGSVNNFDTSYFSNLRNGRGILESDQMLWTDASTKVFVQRYLGLRGFLGLRFGLEFGKSMVKMSNIEVLTGNNGEIRKVCSAFN